MSCYLKLVAVAYFASLSLAQTLSSLVHFALVILLVPLNVPRYLSLQVLPFRNNHLLEYACI